VSVFAFRKSLVVGGIVGAVTASLWFGLCCWISTLEAATDVSLSLAFRPWWDNWRSSAVVFAVAGTSAAIIAALRPETTRRSGRASERTRKAGL
jgi:hypothetical protein